MIVKKLLAAGSVLMILLGVFHAVHVGTSEDVEPYLWIASLLIIIQGSLTLVYLRTH